MGEDNESKECGTSLDGIKSLQVTRQLGMAIEAAEEYKKNLEEYASRIFSRLIAKVEEVKIYVDNQLKLFTKSEESIDKKLKEELSKRISESIEGVRRDYEQTREGLDKRLRELEEGLGKLSELSGLSEKLKEYVSKKDLDAFEGRFEGRFYRRLSEIFAGKGDVERDYDKLARRVTELEAQYHLDKGEVPGPHSSEKPDELLKPNPNSVSVTPNTMDRYENPPDEKSGESDSAG